MTQTRIQEKFYPLTNGITSLLRGAGLTATEWRIWSYLVELDPFGDRYEDFDYLRVMSICECSKTTLWRAIAKFQEFKIFDFQDRGLCVRNLTGASQLRKPETEQPNSAPQTETKTEAKPKPKPKPKTNKSPTTDPQSGSLRDHQVNSDHPEVNDRPEVSDLQNDPWDDDPETSDRTETSDRPELSDLEEIRSAARPQTSDRQEVSDRQTEISEMKQEFQNCNDCFKNEISVSKLQQ